MCRTFINKGGKMHKKYFIAIVLIVSAILTGVYGCSSTSGNIADGGSAPAKPLYLRNNVHSQEHEKAGEYRASYANWTNPGKGHYILPVNTEVVITEGRRDFEIIAKGPGKTIQFEFNEKNMGMNVNQYIRLITSHEPVSLKGFSEIDRRGISDGKAYAGMTKEGIRIALGYPAGHRTPSLESNAWTYWKNRFTTLVVEFDNKGKVVRVRQ